MQIIHVVVQLYSLGFLVCIWLQSADFYIKYKSEIPNQFLIIFWLKTL